MDQRVGQTAKIPRHEFQCMLQILEDGPPPTAMTSLAEERDKLLRSQSFGDFDADLDDDVVALTDDVERERDQYNDFLELKHAIILFFY